MLAHFWALAEHAVYKLHRQQNRADAAATPGSLLPTLKAARRRVLHTIDTGGPGGAETVLLTLVEGLRPGWENLIVVPEHGWLYETLVSRGHSPVVFGPRSAFDMGYLARLARFVHRNQVDLVQTHLFRTAVYGAIAARACRIPLVSTIHGIVDIGQPAPLRDRKLALLDSPSSRLVLVSELLDRAVRTQRRWKHDVLRVILNGIDLSAYEASVGSTIRTELDLPDDAVLVGAVGNVRSPKDYGTLLDAAAILRSRSSRYRIVVVGDTEGEPELYQQLLRRQSALGLQDCLRFCGFRSDIAGILQQLDIFVMSSENEGLPLAMLQAMAAGAPTVATRCGGPQEIIEDGRNGLLVDVRDPAALADAIHRLGENPSFRRALAATGRATVHARFGLQRMVAGYEQLYHELLGSTR